MLEPDQHVEYDSAGVTVVLSSCSWAERPVDWELAADPTFEIGGGSDPTDQLTEIRGVTVLPSGAIAVLETSTKSISVFDSTGRFRHRVGREGEGPGEFATPVMVPNPYGDSVHIFDWRLARWTAISQQELGTAPPSSMTVRPFDGGGGIMRGLIEDRTLAEDISRAFRGPRTVGMNPEVAKFTWVTLDSQDSTVLADFELNRLARVIDRASGTPFTWPVPFVVKPSATTTPAHAVITHGTNFELRYYAADGSLKRIARVDRSARPATQSERDAYTESGTRPGEWLPRPETWDQLLEIMEHPDSVATLDRVVSDTEGWVWARMYDWNLQAAHPRAAARWILFDPTGRAQGVIRAPGELEIVEIGPDYVLGTRQDSLRVEYVQRYDLSRTPR